jgi:hypothetical protein
VTSAASITGASRASRTSLILMRLALASVLFAALTRTVADADLWGHVLFGRDIAQSGTFTTYDDYSFTSDVQWINHEWLAEVLMYGAYAIGGSAGLVAVKSFLLLAMLAIVLVALRHISFDVVVHDLLVFLTVAGTYGRSITFRPQVFSLVLFPALLLTLLSAERRRPKALLAVPAIFVLWTNVHGGWIVGWAAFAIWSAWAFTRSNDYGIPRSWLAVISATSLIATVCNPHGFELWRFLWTTVGLSRDIADWQPLSRLPVALLIPWMTTTFLVVAAGYWGRNQINPSHIAIVTMCWIGSIRVNRIDAFFILSAVMLLAPHIREAFRAIRRSSAAELAARRVQIGSIAAAALAIGLVGTIASRANFRCIPIDEQWAPEPEAVTSARASQLKGRMLTFFDWGEYAIWHLAPDVKVSIDGRRETVYSENLISAHFRLYRDAPGAVDLLHRLQPDYIWLPSRLLVVSNLAAQGWIPIFNGSTSVILARNTLEKSVSTDPQSHSSLRCFPGP